MENNLLDRLKPEYRALLDEYEQKYPNIGGDLKKKMKNNHWIGNMTYYDVCDLMGICSKDNCNYYHVSQLFTQL
jgi:hypothetical protein